MMALELPAGSPFRDNVWRKLACCFSQRASGCTCVEMFYLFGVGPWVKFVLHSFWLLPLRGHVQEKVKRGKKSSQWYHDLVPNELFLMCSCFISGKLYDLYISHKSDSCLLLIGCDANREQTAFNGAKSFQREKQASAALNDIVFICHVFLLKTKPDFAWSSVRTLCWLLKSPTILETSILLPGESNIHWG